MLPKPTRGIRLNQSHPLARGLVGYWLLNEGSGNKVFDLSGNKRTGTLIGSIPRVAGKFGSTLSFGPDGDYISIPKDSALDGDNSFSFCVWVKPDDNTPATRYMIVSKRIGDAGVDSIKGWTLHLLETTGVVRFSFIAETNIIGSALPDTNWHFISVTYNSLTDVASIYIDGIFDTSDTSAYQTNTERLVIGNFNFNIEDKDFKGLIDVPILYNRVLAASEIALLYREPFCMFDRAWRPGLIGGQIIELAGTSTALSSLSATAKASRKVGGTAAGTSDVNGSLGIMGEGPPEMERSWLTEALFNGMTANAFKLGTSLSLGWFWVRVTGCSALYRGISMGGMEEIDFANILAVSDGSRIENPESRIEYISPPSYISHNNGSTYFYVVRRFNNCGYQEHTLAAAVKVSIKSNGELAEPQPNNIYRSKAEQVDSNKVRLTWFYWPCGQGSRPIRFNVYYDDRTGQIDYENPLAAINYKGRRFYSFQSSALEADEDRGGYLFAIRAEDADGIENISLARLKIQLDTLNPDAIDILRAEAV